MNRPPCARRLRKRKALEINPRPKLLHQYIREGRNQFCKQQYRTSQAKASRCLRNDKPRNRKSLEKAKKRSGLRSLHMQRRSLHMQRRNSATRTLNNEFQLNYALDCIQEASFPFTFSILSPGCRPQQQNLISFFFFPSFPEGLPSLLCLPWNSCRSSNSSSFLSRRNF